MSLSFIVHIAGIPARVAYQSHQTRSSSSFLSSAFLSRNALPVEAGRATLSVSVPTTSSRFTSFNAFRVCAQDDIDRFDGGLLDAVLGVDWLGLCHVVASDGSVLFLPSTAECRFRSARSGETFGLLWFYFLNSFERSIRVAGCIKGYVLCGFIPNMSLANSFACVMVCMFRITAGVGSHW